MGRIVLSAKPRVSNSVTISPTLISPTTRQSISKPIPQPSITSLSVIPWPSWNVWGHSCWRWLGSWVLANCQFATLSLHLFISWNTTSNLLTSRRWCLTCFLSSRLSCWSEIRMLQLRAVRVVATIGSVTRITWSNGSKGQYELREDKKISYD